MKTSNSYKSGKPITPIALFIVAVLNFAKVAGSAVVFAAPIRSQTMTETVKLHRRTRDFSANSCLRSPASNAQTQRSDRLSAPPISSIDTARLLIQLCHKVYAADFS